MKVEMWEINRPKPYGKNPRKITNKAIDKVATSIQKFGFRQPIVVDKKGVVIVGHKRLLAAQKLGWPRVPVIEATDLTAAQVKAYRIADNRTSEGSNWDRSLLAEEMEDLRNADLNLEEMTGFDTGQIQEIMGDVEFADDNQEEETEERRIIMCPKCKHQFTIDQ